jgi:hypothetical protein
MKTRTFLLLTCLCAILSLSVATGANAAGNGVTNQAAKGADDEDMIVVVVTVPPAQKNKAQKNKAQKNKVQKNKVQKKRAYACLNRFPSSKGMLILKPGKQTAIAGFYVHTFGGARVSIVRLKKTQPLEASREWRRLAPLPPDEARVLAKTYDDLMHWGVGRGENTVIAGPVKGSAVKLDSFVLRTAPGTIDHQTELSISVPITGEVLWSAKDLTMTGGDLTFPAAVTAMRQWRADHAGAGKLKLTLTRPGTSESVFFTTLTAADEEKTNAELQWWDANASGIMRHIGRAGVFSRLNLDTDRQIESATARKLYPGNDLLSMLKND